MRVAVILALVARLAWAVGPSCDMATELTCPLDDPTVAGDLAAYGDTSGNIDAQCTVSCAAGTLTGDVTGDVTGNADTATALASDPTDCVANQFAHTIAADGDLTCSQPDHGNLAGLTDDDHSQYTLLAGRAGGQALDGGTATSDHLTLGANDETFAVANTGRIRFTERVTFSEDWSVGNVDDARLWSARTITGTGTSTIFPMVRNSDTISYGSGQNAALSPTFYDAVTLAPSANLTDTNTLTLWLGFLTEVGFKPAAGVTATTPDVVGFRAAPRCLGDNAGATATCTRLTGFGAWAPTYALESSVFNTERIGDDNGTNVTVTDVYGFNAGNPATSGTPTVTRFTMYHAQAPTVGTDRYQYAAAEHTITAGAVPAGQAAWGVESGAPNRFYFVNESEQIWRMGYTSTTGTCTGLSTTVAGSVQYCPVVGVGASNATESTFQYPVPGAIRAFAMTCGLTAAPATTSVRTLTLRDDVADTALACTITGAATTCTDREEAGVALAGTSLWDLSEDVTTADADAASASCTIYFTVDAF